MATPAELLGQLAQQFEAAGNPQLAASFRGMMGGVGELQPPSRSFAPGDPRVSTGGQPNMGFAPGNRGMGPVGHGSTALPWRPLAGSGLESVRGTFGRGTGSPGAMPGGAGWQPGPGGVAPPPSTGIGAIDPARWQGIGRPLRDQLAGGATPPGPPPMAQQLPGGAPPVGPDVRGTMRAYARPGPRYAPTPGQRYGNPPFSVERTAGADPLGITGGRGPVPRQGPQGPTMGPGAQPKMQGPRVPGGPGGRPPQSGAGAMGAAAGEWSAPGDAAAAGGRFGARHPVADYRTLVEGYRGGLKGGLGGGKRVAGRLVAGTALSGGPEGLSRYGKFAAGSPFAAKSLAFMKVTTPAFMVGMIGDAMGVNDYFEEGGASDLVAEGLLLGATFGAPFGVPGAMIGAAIGSTLNVLSGGTLIDIAQKIPIVGGYFGSEEVYDIRDDALKFFTQAATAQGNPELAAGAASIFDGYYNMIEAGKLPAGSEMQYILQAGRTMGLTGFPWEPEALTPVYSAEDLAQITSSISEDLRPMYDVAQGLMQQNFDHISDPKVREKLLAAAQDQGSRVMEGIAVSLRGPTSMAMLSEANRPDTGLAGQLAGGNEEFAALLAG